MKKAIGAQHCAANDQARSPEHIAGSSRATSRSPSQPFSKTARTTGKAAHGIPTMRVADMTKPWSAARIFAAASFRAAPVNESDKRHQKKRFGIAGDEKKRRRMRDDRERAEKRSERRQVPAFAEEKKITPETPGRQSAR